MKTNEQFQEPTRSTAEVTRAAGISKIDLICSAACAGFLGLLGAVCLTIFVVVRNHTFGKSEPFSVGTSALIGSMLGVALGWFACRFTSHLIPSGVGLSEAAGKL